MLKFDQPQAQRHLDLLGYAPGDSVFLRFFYHASDTRKSGAINIAGINPTVIEQHQASGRGCYFVVNGGGNKDKDVTHCRAFFYEHDDLNKESQLILWETLELPEPTFQIDTGGKSIHSYWVLDKPVSPQEWKPLQKDLLEYADADRSIKNPSRVMRLAGAWHVSPEGANQTKIVTESDKRYSFEELRAIVPVQQDQPVVTKPAPVNAAVKRSPVSNQLPKHPDLIQLPVLESVPLLDCLPHEIRNKVTNGVPIGTGHNNEAVGAVGQCIYEYAEYLNSIGQSFHPSAEDLFIQFSQTSSVNQRETQMRIDWLEGCQRKEPQFKKSVENCVRGWYWNNYVKPFKGENCRQNQSVNTPVNTSVNTPEPSDSEGFSGTVCSVNEILQLPIETVEKQKKLADLCKASDLSRADFQAIVREHQGRIDIQDAVALDEIRSVKKKDIDIEYVLRNKGLAKAIREQSSLFSTDPFAMVHSILPVFGSVLGAEAGVEILPGYVEPPRLWSLLVQESGMGKSRIFDLVVSHLNTCQERAQEQYKVAKANYQREQSAYDAKLKQAKKEEDFHELDDPPECPVERDFILDNCTPETAIKAIASQAKGCLWAKDEFSLFKSLGQYSSGKENEYVEQLLQLWGGSTINVKRMDDSKRLLSSCAHLCLLGGLQPNVFRQTFSDPHDSQGRQARFVFYRPDALPQRLPEDRELIQDTGLKSILGSAIDICEQEPGIAIPLTDGAYRVYKAFSDSRQKEAEKCPLPSLKYWLRKSDKNVARVARILHAVDWAIGEINREEYAAGIPPETVRRAIYIGEIWRNEFESLQSETTESEGDLTWMVRRIIQRVKEIGKVTTRAVQQLLGRKLSQLAKDQKRRAADVATDLLKTVADLDGFTYGQKGASRYVEQDLQEPVYTAHTQPKTQAEQATEGVNKSVNSTVNTPSTVNSSDLTTHQVEVATPEDWVEIRKNWTEEEIETQVLLSEKFTEVLPRYEQAKRLFTQSDGMASEPKPSGDGHRQVDINRPSPKDSSGSNADAGGVLPRDEASNMELVSGGASTLAGLHPNPPDRAPELRPHSPTHPRDVDGSS